MTKVQHYFNIIDTNSKGDKIGICLLCNPQKDIKMKNRNTSGLRRHLQRKHPQEFEKVCVSKETFEQPVIPSNESYTPQQSLIMHQQNTLNSNIIQVRKLYLNVISQLLFLTILGTSTVTS